MKRFSPLLVFSLFYLVANILTAQIEQPVRLALVQSVTTTEPDEGFGNPTFATVLLTGTETVEIAEGEYLEVDNFGTATDTPLSSFAVLGIQVETGGEALPYIAGEGDTIVGPATCRLYCEFRNNPADQTSKVTVVANILITRGITSLGPLQSDGFGRLVIPEDATGPVSILLEHSSDLINWTGANPGTYDPSEEKRFFRIRAVIGP